MAVNIPINGSISMKQLWETLHQGTYSAPIHGPISFGFEGHGPNPGATYQGNGITPHSLSEWRGYVHAWQGIFRFNNGSSIARTGYLTYWINGSPPDDQPTDEVYISVPGYSTSLVVPFSDWFDGNDMIVYNLYLNSGIVNNRSVVGYSSGSPLTLSYSHHSGNNPANGGFKVGGDLGETLVCCDFLISS